MLDGTLLSLLHGGHDRPLSHALEIRKGNPETDDRKLATPDGIAKVAMLKIQ